jgi:MOSC domain-containing protein YiiM
MIDFVSEHANGTRAVDIADARVVSVSRDAKHHFSKVNCDSITLLTGLGVEGDAHMGVTVKHRSRVRRDPTQPNLRQVHLIHAELIDGLQEQGFAVSAGAIGENITTRGIDLLALPRGSRLRIGATAIIEVTGLRNPCIQLDKFQRGLMAATLGRDAQGRPVRKAGIMGVVLAGGVVCANDIIEVTFPEGPFEPLEPV